MKGKRAFRATLFLFILLVTIMGSNPIDAKADTLNVTLDETIGCIGLNKVNDPKPGDIVWYDFPPEGSKYTGSHDHVGLVVAVDEQYIYTVEGNTTTGTGDTLPAEKEVPNKYNFGNKVNDNKPAVVQAKAHKRTKSTIAGYCRPNYNN